MRLKTALPAALLSTGLAFAATASVAFQKVNDRDEFIQIVGDAELRLGLFGVTLRVTPDGIIKGSAAGWDVTGTWSWQDGYFCREMDWSGTPVPYNCQLVEVNGDQVRFTVDRGAGDDATFNLR